MRNSMLWLSVCLIAFIGVGVASEQPSEPALATEHVQALRKQIAQLQSKPEGKLTVADRLELSRAYLELGENPKAVKNAFLARQADPTNEETWVALVRAQIANLHEVGYAEENFQAAVSKFPKSDKINDLREELFFGQLKYGQPVVAVDHFASWLGFQVGQAKDEPSQYDGDFKTAQRWIEILDQRRVPLFAWTRLQQQLEMLKGNSPAELSTKFDGLSSQIQSTIDLMTPEQRARSSK